MTTSTKAITIYSSEEEIDILLYADDDYTYPEPSSIKSFLSSYKKRRDIENRRYACLAYQAIKKFLYIINKEVKSTSNKEEDKKLKGFTRTFHILKKEYLDSIVDDGFFELKLLNYRDHLYEKIKETYNPDLDKSINIIDQFFPWVITNKNLIDKHRSAMVLFFKWTNDKIYNDKELCDLLSKYFLFYQNGLNDLANLLSGLGNESHGILVDCVFNSFSLKNAVQRVKLSDKHKRIERFSNPENFEEFCFTYFNTQMDNAPMRPFASFQKEAISKVISGKEYIHIWEWFRGAAKSIISTLYIPMWLYATKRSYFILILSHDQEKAKRLLKFMYQHLNTNYLFLHDYGASRIKGTPDNPGSIEVSSDRDKNYSLIVNALSVNHQNPAGVRNKQFRVDTIICDDCEPAQIPLDPKATKKLVNTIRGNILGTFGVSPPGSKVKQNFIYLNNRVNKGGLTEQIVNAFTKHQTDKNTISKTYYSKQYASHCPQTGKAMLIQDGGVPSWPEHVDADAISKFVGMMGPKMAMQQLYHTTLSENDAFNIEWIKYVDRKQYGVPEYIVIYCDPAYSSGSSACNSGIVSLGVFKKEKLFYYIVLDILITKTPDVALEHLKMSHNLHNMYPVRNKLPHFSTIMEGNAGQDERMKPAYDHHKRKNPNFVNYLVSFDVKQKQNKQSRIHDLMDPIKTATLTFEIGLKETAYMEKLKQEMITFPLDSMDGLDALQGAWADAVSNSKRPFNTISIRRENKYDDF